MEAVAQPAPQNLARGIGNAIQNELDATKAKKVMGQV